jgi:hypothetical protein
LFSNDEWRRIIEDIRSSRFWEMNWNYPVWFTQTLNNNGLKLVNTRGDFEEQAYSKKYWSKKTIKAKFAETYVGNAAKRLYKRIKAKSIYKQFDDRDHLFITSKDDLFLGQRLSFKNVNNDIDKIDELIRKTFIFPTITDSRNNKMLDIIKNHNTIAIHARRGDLLNYNGVYYRCGYFKRATRLVKKAVDKPVFVFFCEPGSMEWCRQNGDIFGLDFNHDTVYFVDWNVSNDSYRDMQLMAECKHNIITNSTFGWWGAYLNRNPHKITISPELEINTTHHC